MKVIITLPTHKLKDFVEKKLPAKYLQPGNKWPDHEF